MSKIVIHSICEGIISAFDCTVNHLLVEQKTFNE